MLDPHVQLPFGGLQSYNRECGEFEHRSRLKPAFQDALVSAKVPHQHRCFLAQQLKSGLKDKVLSSFSISLVFQQKSSHQRFQSLALGQSFRKEITFNILTFQ